jgi:hypothetical protein
LRNQSFYLNYDILAKHNDYVPDHLQIITQVQYNRWKEVKVYSTYIRVQYIIDYVPDHLDTKAFAGTRSRKSLLFLHNEKQFFQLTVYKSYPWTGPTCGSSSVSEFSQTRYILQGYPHMYTWTPLGDFPLNESKGYSILISCLQFFLLQSPVSSKAVLALGTPVY